MVITAASVGCVVGWALPLSADAIFVAAQNPRTQMAIIEHLIGAGASMSVELEGAGYSAGAEWKPERNTSGQTAATEKLLN